MSFDLERNLLYYGLTTLAIMASTLTADDAKRNNATKEFRPGIFESQFIDGVLAVVNDQIITAQDVNLESRFLERQQALGYLPSEWEKEEIRDEMNAKKHAIRVRIANRLINELLIVAEFKRRKYQLPKSVIDKRIHRAAAKATSGDLEKFREQLKKAGLTMKGFRERITRKLYNDVLLDHEVFSTIKISPMDVTKRMKMEKKEYQPSVRVKMKMLSIDADEKTIKAIKERLTTTSARKMSLTDIQKSINSGTFFAAAKKKVTASVRVVDWIAVKLVDKRFRPYVAKLKKGERTSIIQMNDKAYVFFMEERDEGKTLPDIVIRRLVRSRLLYEKRKKAQRDFVKRLYNRSYVRKFYVN